MAGHCCERQRSGSGCHVFTICICHGRPNSTRRTTRPCSKASCDCGSPNRFLADHPGHEYPLMSQPVPFFAPVPAREGAEWVQLSWRIFRAHWPRYIGLTSLYLLLMQMCAAIVGPLCMLLNPILSVGFLAAAWHHERGELPEVKHLFVNFKSNCRALLPLGGVHLVGLLFALTMGLLASGLSLDQLRASRNRGRATRGADACHAGDAGDYLCL